jgi:hypothetical protein
LCFPFSFLFTAKGLVDITINRSTTIISLLGPNSAFHKAPFFSIFYSSLLVHLKTLPAASRPRLLVLSTISAPDSKDVWSLSAYLVVTVVWMLAFGAWTDFVESAEVFKREAPVGEGLEWVLFRVALLAEGERVGAKAGYVGRNDWKIKMRMSDIADWAVKEAEAGESEWIGKLPALF